MTTDRGGGQGSQAEAAKVIDCFLNDKNVIFILDFTTCHAPAGEERPDQDHKCKRLHHSKYRLAKVRQWWHFLSIISK